jgi:Asp-tRNA(Asn)/Glu-tRNA(Gln) amidotransferase A subunit family amidase
MTVKESYNVAGLPTTWGFPAFADNRPTEYAVVNDSLGHDAGDQLPVTVATRH